MGFFNFNKKQTQPEEMKTDNGQYHSFSTPFGTIGKGNLSTPYVRSYGSESYCRFGNDNLYPQLINQLYHISPLNGAIICYKTNAVIGGGFELISDYSKTPIEKVDEYTFLKKNKFNKLIRQCTKDLILHGRVCIIVTPNKNGVALERVGPEKVRNNKNKTLFTISDDWSIASNMYELPEYSKNVEGPSLYQYEMDDDAGQDIYPIPVYCSALNWAFVDGESSYLHKSNILNSIFPSFMIKIAKKFGNSADLEAFQKTIEQAKGASETGRIMAFVSNDKESLPDIVPIPINNNDKLFESTDTRTDLQLSRAHSIDPLLVGIRTTGALGSGTDIEIAYTIFEKNVVMPLRELVTEFSNELLSIGGIKSTIEINNFQIIENKIIQK